MRLTMSFPRFMLGLALLITALLMSANVFGQSEFQDPVPLEHVAVDSYQVATAVEGAQSRSNFKFEDILGESARPAPVPNQVVTDDELPIEEELTTSNIFGNLIVPLTSALMIIGGFLSYRIPILKSIPKATYRVFAFALITGLGLIIFGVADFWQPALAYFMSTSVYEAVLKPLGLRSKRPAVV